jgi:hypothetical protein
MPERVTKEERLVSRALEKARKVKELLNRENDTNITEKVIEIEIVENKKIKPTMADKIPNQTQKKEGYGLAGEITKAKFKGPRRESPSFSSTVVAGLKLILQQMNRIVRDMEDSRLKEELNEQLDEADELLLEMHKYGLRNESGVGRQDSEYLAGARS